MTPKQSKLRAFCYIMLAMIAAATSGLMSIEFTDPKQVAFFALGILGAGFTALRSYIDQSPTQVEPPPPPGKQS